MKKSVFSGKTIALGVSGGIAAYKAVDLASKLTQEGTTVKVVMSQNATRFVSPITFQSVTNEPVLTDLFSGDFKRQIHHISISEEANLVVVAPATANIIAKAAHGIADDALSTVILAARSQVVMVPAMNNFMWLNAATQQNLHILESRGISVIKPEVGRLACGEENAIGRFPDVEVILDHLRSMLSRTRDLEGKTILVTAGSTREPIDPVRFIGNRSSGKMGYAIAAMAQARGARVVLISGPTSVEPPAGVKVINIETAGEMHQAVLDNLAQADAVIMAAAVADFKPLIKHTSKIKKDRMPAAIDLELNPDILQSVAGKKGKKLVVGFAAESDNLVENALKKLKEKKLDLIVANDIARPGVGFDSNFNYAVLIDKKGQIGNLETIKKADLAERIIDWIVNALKSFR
ncbi:MAG: bifunctional phosphopantothenoylcysteine decarboxylase/phosphopantothenate--cysteine ligase CoaBC [Firmicutes bacterium]|nr:bifunctional phosphopantothenoylcysteine decarboxylase/phosphopantothenate--cysteine ligase CoaBC [Bacillota bacterium]